MARSHSDSDFLPDREWIKSLYEKAQRMEEGRLSEITAGKPDEQPLAEWEAHDIHVGQLPTDEHGILRISIGGGDDTPVKVNYCRFRGDRQKCVDLVRKALRALERGRDE